ncbi:hypothetical protein FA13DRAFT_1715925 [Coprinellus micaceus]|uniref:Uncharacterized protein n=1 Tax=Coprinellus micaceus TaxID=71717 RepID=A0A4Y7SLX7_COPMI|nr:hypothetical protein FA13DRAFT_1715925 [Coprinellus micaceus]
MVKTTDYTSTKLDYWLTILFTERDEFLSITDDLHTRMTELENGVMDNVKTLTTQVDALKLACQAIVPALTGLSNLSKDIGVMKEMFGRVSWVPFVPPPSSDNLFPEFLFDTNTIDAPHPAGTPMGSISDTTNHSNVGDTTMGIDGYCGLGPPQHTPAVQFDPHMGYQNQATSHTYASCSSSSSGQFQSSSAFNSYNSSSCHTIVAPVCVFCHLIRLMQYRHSHSRVKDQFFPPWRLSHIHSIYFGHLNDPLCIWFTNLVAGAIGAWENSDPSWIRATDGPLHGWKNLEDEDALGKWAGVFAQSRNGMCCLQWPLSPQNTPQTHYHHKVQLLEALQHAQTDIVRFMDLHDQTAEQALVLENYAERLHTQGKRLEAINERVTAKLETPQGMLEQHVS